jgi:isopenicillin N synthase-like dioxygenase
MKYGKFSPEEIEKLEDGLWSRGHTDLGSYTLLFRQPVAGLQIKDNETGSWKWARPLDGSLTVNACDALSFLTGGYIKSTVHRVNPTSPYTLNNNTNMQLGVGPSQRPASRRSSRPSLLFSRSE